MFFWIKIGIVFINSLIQGGMMVEVPCILVKTWLDLYLNSDDREIREHVYQQLKGNFGSVEGAKEYIESFQTRY